jgi:hypothetical protein
LRGSEAGQADRGHDKRLEQARLLLARDGIEAPISALGPEGEILAVRAPFELRAALARLAPEARALGYRYVAVEIDVVGGMNPGNQ